MTSEDLVTLMQGVPRVFGTEARLQEHLADALTAAGYDAVREVRLSDGVSRIDILVGRIGIEVKVKGSLTDVRRQLSRYARNDELDALILVTTKATHHGLPQTIGGKPLALCSLVGMSL